MSAIAQYRNQTRTLPPGTVEETTDPSTLVVGVWEPGRGNIDTLALDPLTYGNKSYDLAKKNPRFKPTFIGDFMQISNRTIGLGKYKRIAFQGVCPVSDCMGAKPCVMSGVYESIDPLPLAKKVQDLISRDGGYVFFRHCLASCKEDGVEFPEKRAAFIRTFETAGFIHLTEFPSAYCSLAHPAPIGIPDHSNSKSPEDKWLYKNGGMVFYFHPDMINDKDDFGRTRLHTAIIDGNLDMAMFLMQNGADPSIPDDDGKTPVRLAIECGHLLLAANLVGQDIYRSHF